MNNPASNSAALIGGLEPRFRTIDRGPLRFEENGIDSAQKEDEKALSSGSYFLIMLAVLLSIGIILSVATANTQTVARHLAENIKESK